MKEENRKVVDGTGRNGTEGKIGPSAKAQVLYALHSKLLFTT